MDSNSSQKLSSAEDDSFARHVGDLFAVLQVDLLAEHQRQIQIVTQRVAQCMRTCGTVDNVQMQAEPRTHDETIILDSVELEPNCCNQHGGHDFASGGWSPASLRRPPFKEHRGDCAPDIASLQDEDGVFDNPSKSEQKGSVHFQLHEFKDNSHGLAAAVTVSASTLNQVNRSELLNEELIYKSKADHPWYVIGSSSAGRVLWDIVGGFLLILDAITTPLEISFDLAKNRFLSVLSQINLAYWSLDIVCSFLTTYENRREHEVVALKLIAKHYLKTWFCFDAFLVTVELIPLLEHGSGSVVSSAVLLRLLRVLRSLRSVRTVRLFRLAKLKRKMTTMLDQIDSLYIQILLGMIQNIMVILFLNHFVACAWHWLGVQSPNTGWIASHNFGNVSSLYLYLTAYHWSLTQFTPASMHVQPQTLTERFFALIVLIFALCVFSSFLGSISSRMSQLRSLSGKSVAAHRILIKYFKKHRISETLKQRILAHANLAAMRDKTLDTESVVKTLSLPLQVQLRYELFITYLHSHPFFKELDYFSQTVIQDICTSAVTTSLISPCDVAFRAGNAATAMHWVYQGTMRYTLEAGDSEIQLVRSGDWLSEAALWTTWFHVGHLEAISVCDLLLLDSHKFRISIHKFPVTIGMVKEYGQQFIDRLNEQLDMSGNLNCGMSDVGYRGSSELLATRNEYLSTRSTK